MHTLTPGQTDTLHTWLAVGYPYPTLATMMRNHFGKVITAATVSWHRHHFASKIAELRAEAQRQQERRDRERLAKAARRSGSISTGRHCPTCQCSTHAPHQSNLYMPPPA